MVLLTAINHFRILFACLAIKSTRFCSLFYHNKLEVISDLIFGEVGGKYSTEIVDLNRFLGIIHADSEVQFLEITYVLNVLAFFFFFVKNVQQPFKSTKYIMRYRIKGIHHRRFHNLYNSPLLAENPQLIPAS